jgi:hypothetical protein
MIETHCETTEIKYTACGDSVAKDIQSVSYLVILSLHCRVFF